MAKRSTPDHRIPEPIATPRTGVTLGALFAKAGLVVPPPVVPARDAGPRPTAAAFVEAPPVEPAISAAPDQGRDLCAATRLVVRRERKGHSGHTATVVEGLLEAGVDATDVGKQLKRALGCGASVDDGVLVLQGDVAERAAAWLEGQGVKRVIRGN